MRRLIPATVLLLLITAVCLWGCFTVLNAADSFKTEIARCESLYNAGDILAATKCAKRLKEDWFKTSRHISAYTNHRPLNDIGILVSLLPEAASKGDPYEFTSLINRIRTELQIIYKEQSPNLENLY